MWLIEAGSATGLRIIRGLPRRPMEQEQPEPIEEYVPGVANGRHYMARLYHLPESVF